MATDSIVSSSTADLIRRAEQDISAGKHLLALGLLAEAARREPFNDYIGALVVKADRGIESMCTCGSEPLNDGTASERRVRLASLALRGEFGEGIGLLPQEADATGGDGRIRLLTTVAVNLYERGAFEEAIQALMKAHLLDPGHPEVEACERLLQPALETMRKRPRPVSAARTVSPEEDDSGRENLTAYLQKNAQAVSHDASARAAADVVPYGLTGESRRLEALRARQDLERRKREILLWRQASGPPALHAAKRVPKVGTRVPGDRQPAATPQQRAPQLSTFFSKLKQGRLFG